MDSEKDVNQMDLEKDVNPTDRRKKGHGGWVPEAVEVEQERPGRH